ncbi:MAG: hypothetical protein ACRD72_23835 [Candidatus Angelobacter sp.]
MKFDKILDVLINKFHIILGAIAQGTVFFYSFRTGHDIGAGVQNSLYAYYAFLLGHAATYQKWPDSENPDNPPKS